MIDLMTAATATFSGLAVNVTTLYVAVIGIIAISVAFVWIRKALRGRG